MVRIDLERIQVTDQMIDKEKVEISLNNNPTNIVNILIRMVILGNTVRRYMQCKEKKSLRR